MKNSKKSLRTNVTMLCILFVITLSPLYGCVPKTQPALPTIAESPKFWRNFLLWSERASKDSGPYRITTSLRYKNDREGHRVTAYLWGNGDKTIPAKEARSPYPIRLDILSGVGVTVAKIREDAESFIAYEPGDNSAWVYTDEQRALVNFGVPVPFSLADLILVLTGRYEEFFLHNNEKNHAMPVKSVSNDGSIIFILEPGQLPGEVELNANGMPVRWSEKSGTQSETGWVMHLDYNKDTPDSSEYGPSRVRLTYPKGYEAVVTVKERTRLGTPFKAEQLELKLPDDAVKKILQSDS